MDYSVIRLNELAEKLGISPNAAEQILIEKGYRCTTLNGREMWTNRPRWTKNMGTFAQLRVDTLARPEWWNLL